MTSPLPTRALSLRQPWAWLVVHGPKRIENRRWPTSFRGDFLVHAAKGMTRDEYEGAFAYARSLDPTIVLPRIGELRIGGVIGRARLVDVIPPRWHDPDRYSGAHAWHMPEQHGFVLDDVAPLPFTPCRGMLGFFEVPAEVLRAIEEASRA